MIDIQSLSGYNIIYIIQYHSYNHRLPESNVSGMLFQLLTAVLTLEALMGGGGGVKLTHPPSALNFCSLTDCQKLWHNCSLFLKTSFDTN